MQLQSTISALQQPPGELRHIPRLPWQNLWWFLKQLTRSGRSVQCASSHSAACRLHLRPQGCSGVSPSWRACSDTAASELRWHNLQSSFDSICSAQAHETLCADCICAPKAAAARVAAGRHPLTRQLPSGTWHLTAGWAAAWWACCLCVGPCAGVQRLVCGSSQAWWASHACMPACICVHISACQSASAADIDVCQESCSLSLSIRLCQSKRSSPALFDSSTSAASAYQCMSDH